MLPPSLRIKRSFGKCAGSSWRPAQRQWRSQSPHQQPILSLRPPPTRKWLECGGYRFGFNGKEMDNEVKGTGIQYDYGFRIYDARIAKFLSVDPLTKEYSMLTPYQFASNTPVWAKDLDGLEATVSWTIDREFNELGDQVSTIFHNFTDIDNYSNADEIRASIAKIAGDMKFDNKLDHVEIRQKLDINNDLTTEVFSIPFIVVTPPTYTKTTIKTTFSFGLQGGVSTGKIGRFKFDITPLRYSLSYSMEEYINNQTGDVTYRFPGFSKVQVDNSAGLEVFGFQAGIKQTFDVVDGDNYKTKINLSGKDGKWKAGAFSEYDQTGKNIRSGTEATYSRKAIFGFEVNINEETVKKRE